jgi:Spy/CpxP family protein refolding chaperone
MSIQNIRRSVLIAVGIGVLAFSGLFAGRLLGRQMGPGFSHGGPPNPARMFDHISRELDLTDAQQAQIRGILKSHADEILAHVQAGMDARRALHDAVVAQPIDDAALRSLGAQAGTVHGDGAVLFAKIRAEIWPVLTPDQQQKFAAFHARMGRKGGDELTALGAFLRGES